MGIISTYDITIHLYLLVSVGDTSDFVGYATFL